MAGAFFESGDLARFGKKHQRQRRPGWIPTLRTLGDVKYFNNPNDNFDHVFVWVPCESVVMVIDDSRPELTTRFYKLMTCQGVVWSAECNLYVLV